MLFCTCFPVVTAAVAVLMDLRAAKVDNGWIAFSLGVGFLVRMLTDGFRGIPGFFAGALLPLILLGILFIFRMLGPGDIKLFCALGGMMGAGDICRCIFVSFFLGACISFAILISEGSFCQRFHYLFQYICEFLQTGERKPYYKKGMEAPENFHFTVPVLMSVLLYAGGVY